MNFSEQITQPREALKLPRREQIKQGIRVEQPGSMTPTGWKREKWITKMEVKKEFMTVNVDNQSNVTIKEEVQYTEDFIQDRKDNTLQLNSN